MTAVGEKTGSQRAERWAAICLGCTGCRGRQTFREEQRGRFSEEQNRLLTTLTTLLMDVSDHLSGGKKQRSSRNANPQGAEEQRCCAASRCPLEREALCKQFCRVTQTLADSGGAISVMEILPLTVLWMTSTAELTLSVLL